MPLQYEAKDAVRLWPVGDYDAIIQNVEDGTSKSSGSPMQTVTYAVYNADGKEKQIKEYIVIPSCTFKIRQIADALGRRQEFESQTFQIDDYIGSGIVVALGIEDGGEYDDKNVIKKVKPATVTRAPAPPPQRQAPAQPQRQQSTPALAPAQRQSIVQNMRAKQAANVNPVSPVSDEPQIDESEVPF